MKQTALDYLEKGLSIIPTDRSKRSIVQWKPYEMAPPTPAQVNDIFNRPGAQGLAIVCGAASGNLEVIDFDLKYDITDKLWNEFLTSASKLPFFDSLPIIQTVGGGYHIYYRCECIDGNQKLAQRHTTESERIDNPHNKIKVLIETRGQGGYVIAPPSDGYAVCHGSFDSIPIITIDQRSDLLSLCRSFNEVLDEVPITYRERCMTPAHKSPFTDYNERGDIVQLLQKHGWRVVKDTSDKTTFLRPGDTKSKSSGDYNKNIGLFGVFSTSTEFEPMKGYRPAAVYCKLECNDNWKLCYRRLSDEGYGEAHIKIDSNLKHKINKYKENGLDDKQIATLISKEEGYDEGKAQKIVAQADQIDGLFEWQGKKRVIVYRNYVEWLKNNNYYLFFYDPSSPIYKMVNIIDGKVKEANNYMIKQALVNEINENGGEDRNTDMEVLIKNPNLFLNNIYEYLDEVKIKWLRDDPQTCYIPFQSCVVKITKDDIVKLNYGEFKDIYIWESDLITNEKCDSIDIFSKETDLECQFDKFIRLICNNEDERVYSVYSIIGYLLHKHKDPSRAWAVILGEETDDDSKGGGTGKGIFIKALEKILNTVTIDGKNFKADKSFAYQRVKLDTKLVAIQDVDRIFDFEKFYSIITEGWTIEKKNKDELYISYQDSPKVILTTNYTINDTGNHAKRRQKVIEFSDYFGAHRTPRDEFGMLMFEDWDRDEWNRFYNFAFRCVNFYFQHGVVDVSQGDKYRLKKVRTMFGEDFCSWFTETAVHDLKNYQKLNDVYKDFLMIYDLEKKEFSSKRFKKALEVAALNFNFILHVSFDRSGRNEKLIKLSAIN